MHLTISSTIHSKLDFKTASQSPFSSAETTKQNKTEYILKAIWNFRKSLPGPCAFTDLTSDTFLTIKPSFLEAATKCKCCKTKHMLITNAHTPWWFAALKSQANSTAFNRLVPLPEPWTWFLMLLALLSLLPLHVISVCGILWVVAFRRGGQHGRANYSQSTCQYITGG